jgi:hypothetical protein
MNNLDDRNRYRSDQGVSLKGLPLLVAGPVLAAIAAAWALMFLFFQGWYLLMVVPMFGGLLIGAVLYLLVGWTHCRNSWVAGGLGLLAGLIAYLGYYHFCLLQHLPPGNAARFDLLPRYIVLRLQTDVTEEVGRAPVDNQPRKPATWMNSFTFLFELAIIAGFPAAIAWRRAWRAYCPELRQWLEQETALFPPCSGEVIKDALENGQLAEFLASNPAGGDPQAACRLILEYVQPADDSPLSYPIYLSIKDLPAEKRWFWPKQARRTYLRQVELTTAEVLTLRPVFAKLARLLATQHAALRDEPATVLPVSIGSTTTDEVATIAPVPEPYRQRVRTSGYALKVNLLGLTPLAFIAGGVGLLFLGGHFVSRNEIVASLGPFVLGALSCAWGIYTGLYCLCVYENRWIERRLRAEIRQRPHVLVEADAVDAVYVSLIPRENWAKVKLTMSTDLLLMRIDAQRRQVLLEGDCDRYRIPAGAIAACEPQCFFHPIDTQHQNELWMVRLMVDVAEGRRELLLSVSHTAWRPQTNTSRQRIAQETCQKVKALRDSSLKL